MRSLSEHFSGDRVTFRAVSEHFWGMGSISEQFQSRFQGIGSVAEQFQKTFWRWGHFQSNFRREEAEQLWVRSGFISESISEQIGSSFRATVNRLDFRAFFLNNLTNTRSVSEQFSSSFRTSVIDFSKSIHWNEMNFSWRRMPGLSDNPIMAPCASVWVCECVNVWIVLMNWQKHSNAKYEAQVAWETQQCRYSNNVFTHKKFV